jgi:hypothetical protein
MRKVAKVLPDDYRTINRMLCNLLGSNDSQENIKRQIAKILMKYFNADACIIARFDPNQKDEMIADVNVCKVPDGETVVGEDEDITPFQNGIVRSARKSLELANKKKMEEITNAKIEIGNGKSAFSMSAFVIYKQKVIGMVTLIREVNFKRNNREDFSRNMIHVNALLIRDPLYLKP